MNPLLLTHTTICFTWRGRLTWLCLWESEFQTSTVGVLSESGVCENKFTFQLFKHYLNYLSQMDHRKSSKGEQRVLFFCFYTQNIKWDIHIAKSCYSIKWVLFARVSKAFICKKTGFCVFIRAQLWETQGCLESVGVTALICARWWLLTTLVLNMQRSVQRKSVLFDWLMALPTLAHTLVPGTCKFLQQVMKGLTLLIGPESLRCGG